jgi:hypothetical protein
MYQGLQRTIKSEFRVFWEAVHTSETSVNFNVTTRRYIQEDSEFHTRRHENLKSHTIHQHHHMALQPNWGPVLSLWDFVTITFLQGWIVSPAPNPQELGTHFSRLLRHAWCASPERGSSPGLVMT